MSNLVAFPDQRRAREEAAGWLTRLDRGLTAQERAEIERWLKELAHREALIEMGRLWNDLDVMSVLTELFPLRRASQPRQRAAASRWLIPAAGAACLLALLGTVSVLGPRLWAPHTPHNATVVARAAPALHTYTTAVGANRSVALRDGSAVTLNTNTSVTVGFSAHARDVFLWRGEANFAVAHDTTRPFNVHVGKRILQAVGTAFNVRIVSPDDIELTVTQGRVKVLPQPAAATSSATPAAATALATTVSAHEIAIVEPDSQSVRVLAPADMAARLAWQHGMLIFRGEPLERVLAEVDRYTSTRFVLSDDALRNVRVGGYFRAGDIDGLLIALRDNFQIDSQRDGTNRIILSAAARP